MGFSREIKEAAIKQIKDGGGLMFFNPVEWPNGKPVFEELVKEGVLRKGPDGNSYLMVSCFYRAPGLLTRVNRNKNPLDESSGGFSHLWHNRCRLS